MADAPEKVNRGAPFIYPASTHNAFVDAAVDHQRRAMSTESETLPRVRGSNLVLVRNDSGENRARFDILGIDVPVILPEDNLPEFSNRVALSGITPTIDDHASKFVVLDVPLGEGAFGLGWLSGVTPVRIDVIDLDHAQADVTDGFAGHLKSGSSGVAQILWKELGLGVKWAVVRLGGAGAPTIGYGVVRDIGNGTENFILVQRVRQIRADPGWAFDPAGAEQVACWPDVVSGEYEAFRSAWSGPWTRDVGITHIPIIRGEFSWIALPMTAMEMVAISQLINLPRTDGFIP